MFSIEDRGQTDRVIIMLIARVTAIVSVCIVFPHIGSL